MLRLLTRLLPDVAGYTNFPLGWVVDEKSFQDNR